MKASPRHQCLIYQGSPEKHLPGLAITIRQRLDDNYRCLYLNSPPMIAGIKSWLKTFGTDVELEIAKTSLILSSDQSHLLSSDRSDLAKGVFDIDLMLKKLDDAVDQALKDGYRGLWATGDMLWEFGHEKNFEKLLEYEWRLEELFIKRPQLCGVCQYHSDVLPREIVRQGFLAHPTLYVNETLSRINPHYLQPKTYTAEAAGPELNQPMLHLCNIKYVN